MATRESHTSADARRIAQVVDECIERRAAGEDVSDDEIIAAHPDLMPALGERLSKLRFIQRACEHVRRDSDRPESGDEPDGAARSDPGVAADRIPGYKITREIRRGAQGVVYEATQLSTRRNVAIKVLREGPFAGSSDRIRFQREVQVLASLRHPNIVAVHHGGVADGCFYFVMDYVAGQSLTEYMAARIGDVPGRRVKGDRRFPALRPTLDLFVKICDAVNAAHVAGVIHRDLKPGNIRIDTDGEPQILDFGLAKILEPRGPGEMTVTHDGQFFGSLPWASPEQAEGEFTRVDTRTDVYSLGVILYQMLTGRFPYDVYGSTREVLDNIINTEPASPRDVARADNEATTLASRIFKRTRLRQGAIDDDIETIVLKCLAKERDRRYQTAGELAREIRRYLAGQPIEAKRESTLYVLSKQLRKHRVPVAVAATFLLVIVGASIALAIQTARARHQAESAEASLGFLTDILGSLDPLSRHSLAGLSPDPDAGQRPFAVRGGGHELSVVEMLTLAGPRIDDQFADQPELAATAHETVGMSFLGLWQHDKAQSHLREALRLREQAIGPEHPETLRSRLQLAHALREARCGQLTEAEALTRRTLDAMSLRYGADDPKTLTCRALLADVLMDQRRFADAEVLYRDTVAAQEVVLGPEDRNTLRTRTRWVCARMWQGRLVEGDAEIQDVYRACNEHFGPDHNATIHAQAIGGLFAALRGRSEEAEDTLRDAYANSCRVLGTDHPYTLMALRWLGQAVTGEKRWEEKERCLRTALVGMRATLGDAHEETLLSFWHLGWLCRRQGKLEEAIDLFQAGAESVIASRSEHHRRGARFMAQLARTLREAGRCDEARDYVLSALDAHRKWAARPWAIAPDLYLYAWLLLTCEPADLRDPETALVVARQAVELFEAAETDTVYFGKPGYTQDVLALAYYQVGDLPNAIAAQRAAIDLLSARQSGYRTRYAMKLAFYLMESGDLEAAEQMLRASVENVVEEHGPEQGEIADRMAGLAIALLDAEEYSTFATFCTQLSVVRQGVIPESPRQFVGPVVRLCGVLWREEQFELGERLLRDSLAIQQLSMPADDWRIAHTTSVLGAFVAARGEFAEAESLLRGSHATLVTEPEVPPAFVRESADRLVDLYDAWNKPDQADEWRARLGAIQLSKPPDEPVADADTSPARSS